jgi:integrase
MKGEIIERGRDKDNNWVFQIRIFLGKKKLENGKEKKLYHYKTVKLKTKSQKELDRIRTEELNKVNRGEIKEPDKITVTEFLDRWLEVALKNSVEAVTYYDYKMISARYIKKEIGTIRLSKLTADRIQEFYNRLTERGLSARTVHYTHAILYKALHQAVVWEYLTRNPANFINLPKKQRREMKVFSPEEAEKFLEAAAADAYYAMWLVALDGGLSPEEYLGLQWDDFRDGAVHIQRALCRDHLKKEFYFKEPKAEHRRRRIPLSPVTINALDWHRREQLEWKLKRGAKYQNTHNLIFTNPKGSPLHLSNLRDKHFNRILEKAKLPKIRIYDLRHTMATLALLENVHPKKVQDRLGHSQYAITMDTYSHIIPGMQNEVSNVLDNVLFSKIKLREKSNPG